MDTWAEQALSSISADQQPEKRKLVMIVSSDKIYAEALRSHLARQYDVILARYGGEAAAKAVAVHIDLALVDLGAPILGLEALARVRGLQHPPVFCALATPRSSEAHSEFIFDYVLARPTDGSELVERVRFVLGKVDHAA